MSQTYYYSASVKGFFLLENKSEYEGSPAGWPADAVEVSNADYHRLFAGQAEGEIITPGDNGYPVLVQPVTDWPAWAVSERDRRIAEANAITADWRTELQLDTISDDDRQSLINWMSYIRALKQADLSRSPDINWPEKPE